MSPLAIPADAPRVIGSWLGRYASRVGAAISSLYHGRDGVMSRELTPAGYAAWSSRRQSPDTERESEQRPRPAAKRVTRRPQDSSPDGGPREHGPNS
jgi:hypothetical protein